MDWVDYSAEFSCPCKWKGKVLECLHLPPKEDEEESGPVESGQYQCPNCKSLLLLEFMNPPSSTPYLQRVVRIDVN